MEDYAENITAERVRRVIDGYGEKEETKNGTGGGFSFFELGEPLLIEDNINENVEIEKIKEYVWYSETRKKYAEQDEKYLLGVDNNTAYYFYYDGKNAITSLNLDFFRKVKSEKYESYLIYADTCFLPDDIMKKFNITFKKIPKDVARI
jgi:adenine-specific DNA-methyltransferase